MRCHDGCRAISFAGKSTHRPPLFRPLGHHSAVEFALGAFARAESGLTIRDVAQEAGLSQRRFIQVFAPEVGMSPKLFCRVRRFHQTLSLLRPTTPPNWAQLALDCGYFDQSHLIRDFRIFSGISPTECVRQRSERVMQNHVPLPEQVNFFQYGTHPLLDNGPRSKQNL
jgi:AraC-like DNA-binding protein